VRVGGHADIIGLFDVRSRATAYASCHIAQVSFSAGCVVGSGADGREQDGGRVRVWRPPHQLVLSWLMGSDWTFEPDPARASEIDVRFLAEAPDRTRLEFEHRHLERYGEQAERMRSVLDGPSGSVGVVSAYAAAARRP